MKLVIHAPTTLTPIWSDPYIVQGYSAVTTHTLTPLVLKVGKAANSADMYQVTVGPCGVKFTVIRQKMAEICILKWNTCICK